MGYGRGDTRRMLAVEKIAGRTLGLRVPLEAAETLRLCACGCETPLAPERRSDAIWATDACRTRFRRGRAPASATRLRTPDTGRTQKLGFEGQRLWESIVGDLAEGWELDARELHLLERACRCADDLAALEAAIDADGPTTTGSRGQTVVHPALGEARHLRLVQLRLLAALDLHPDLEEVPHG